MQCHSLLRSRVPTAFSSTRHHTLKVQEGIPKTKCSDTADDGHLHKYISHSSA